MQSDGNSFCGDVVSYSLKKTSRDVDNILYQIYKNKCSYYYYNDFNSLQENAYKHYKSTKTQFYEFLIVMCCISSNMNFFQSLFKLKIFIIKNQEVRFSYSWLQISALDAVFIILYSVTQSYANSFFRRCRLGHL